MYVKNSNMYLSTVFLLHALHPFSRMIKETMRASGANATQKHLEEVSMCAMLLMDTAKKVDHMFGVSQSVSHTTRDATLTLRR